MKKGVFVLSLDTELAWGCCSDKVRLERNGRYYAETRDSTKSLLDLLEKHKISATWSVVGHLFLSGCSPVNGAVHPEIIRPAYSWFEGDWFKSDPCSDAATDPIWYGRDIVESIQSCKVPQEVGCHTFSHIIVDDPGCRKECLDSELKLCQSLAGELGIRLKSFAFPRNKVNYVDVLADNGFLAYRGKESHWYDRCPDIIQKIVFFTDTFIFFLPPPVEIPEKKECWNIRGSYFYGHSHGLAGLLPVPCRVAKAKRGIDRAAGLGAVFHLWFHPFNLATNPQGLLKGLDRIFAYVESMRNQGKIENLTMGELVRQLEAQNG